MKSIYQHFKAGLMLVTIALCLLLSLAWLPSLISAASSIPPPRNTETPPPPTPTLTGTGTPPLVTPTPAPAKSQTPAGAFIELRLEPGRADVWTVVQWQDAFGGWHDVTGWQGTLDEIADRKGRKVWWVAEKDLRTGPFRWVVYQGQGGVFLAASASFYLPDVAGETVNVQLSPEP
ncbi:MAG: hypothetical protein V3S14_12410 [Anaerolineae bacterium]